MVDAMQMRRHFGADVAPRIDPRQARPRSLLLAASRLGAEPRHSIVVEDAPIGIEAGKRAGMRTVASADARSHGRGRLRRHAAGVGGGYVGKLLAGR